MLFRSLDRVNDPLFGFGEVDYTDERVVEYLESYKNRSTEDLSLMSVNITMSPVEGPVNTSRYNLPIFLTLSPGMPEFTFGVACSKIFCDVTPISPNMYFSVYYKNAVVGSESPTWNYASNTTFIQSSMGTVQANSNGWLGWWQWKIFFSVYTGGDAAFGFSWYGGVSLPE